MDLAWMSEQERDAFLQDRDLDALRRKIDTKVNAATILIPDYRGYAIVQRQQQYHTLPLLQGAPDSAAMEALAKGNALNNSDRIVCASVPECKAAIDDLIALQELEQRSDCRSLQLPLPEFLDPQKSESRSLFGLPAEETWACFRLLLHSLLSSRQQEPGTTTVTPSLSLPAEMLLDYARKSSNEHTYSFAACANYIQMQLLRDVVGAVADDAGPVGCGRNAGAP